VKLLESETNLLSPFASADECAALLADTVPLVMRAIRAEMRRHSSADLSLPQFRALLFLRRYPGASLSEVSAHIGLTLPSISKMIARLEARDLVARRSAPGDRRRTCLELTAHGTLTLQSASEATRESLAQRLSALSPEKRSGISQAMTDLRSVFSAEPLLDDPSNRKENS
jgi:DNA-binding MarR family transcriptional regulator